MKIIGIDGGATKVSGGVVKKVYDYSENKATKVIVYNLLVTVFFMLFIYFLFSVLLKVQVPRFFLY